MTNFRTMTMRGNRENGQITLTISFGEECITRRRENISGFLLTYIRLSSVTMGWYTFDLLQSSPCNFSPGWPLTILRQTHFFISCTMKERSKLYRHQDIALLWPLWPLYLPNIHTLRSFWVRKSTRTKMTDCMNLRTHIVTSSFKPALLNPKTASCTLFYELHWFGRLPVTQKATKTDRSILPLFDAISHWLTWKIGVLKNKAFAANHGFCVGWQICNVSTIVFYMFYP